jgi:hypothetical protein
MATTGAPGITVDTEGFRTINKEHRGERIFARLGLVCQEQAERRLARGITPTTATDSSTARNATSPNQSIGDLLMSQLGTYGCSLPISECSKSIESMTPHSSLLSPIASRQASSRPPSTAASK